MSFAAVLACSIVALAAARFARSLQHALKRSEFS
jgi:hypothetical protein